MFINALYLLFGAKILVQIVDHDTAELARFHLQQHFNVLISKTRYLQFCDNIKAKLHEHDQMYLFHY